MKDKQVISVEQVGTGKFPLYCEKWEDGLSFVQDWFIRTSKFIEFISHWKTVESI